MITRRGFLAALLAAPAAALLPAPRPSLMFHRDAFAFVSEPFVLEIQAPPPGAKPVRYDIIHGYANFRPDVECKVADA